ncbi:MAG: transcription termination factor Rho [Pseudomonadota bacterium]
MNRDVGKNHLQSTNQVDDNANILQKNKHKNNAQQNRFNTLSNNKNNQKNDNSLGGSSESNGDISHDSSSSKKTADLPPHNMDSNYINNTNNVNNHISNNRNFSNTNKDYNHNLPINKGRNNNFTNNKNRTNMQNNHIKSHNQSLSAEQKSKILLQINKFIKQEMDLVDFYNLSINVKLMLADICCIENKDNLIEKELHVELLKSLISLNYIFTYEGFIELLPEGYGFLHKQENSFTTVNTDVYVPNSLLRMFDIRKGDKLKVIVKAPMLASKFLAANSILQLNDKKPVKYANRVCFKDFRAISPDKKFAFDNIINSQSCKVTSRIIDFISPIGFGQRALIVAPPRVGKTSIIHVLIQYISYFHKDVVTFALLIGERPEEVTHMEDNTDAIVISSTFDDPAAKQIQAAEMTIARAKRLVEMGKDVVIFVDSLTRLVRAYNINAPNSNKIMSGGVDAAALLKAKELFGPARNIAQGGSLTIIATVLVDTGSKMDTVVFEEFKGTSNCDIVLDKKAAESRMFPSINIKASGTRNDDILHGKYLKQVNVLRKILNTQENANALKFMISKLNMSDNNEQLFELLSNTNVKN